jgi:hypothetical protein
MLAKKTSKNQITLPKALVERLPDAQYFDVTLRKGALVLTPVVVRAPAERLRAVRAKIRALGMREKDVHDAIAWARRASP